MIDRRELLAAAANLGLLPNVVEKDYVLGWLLAEIFNHPALADKWVFKGGTCLKKCYFETYRFSEDLDFTLTDKSHLNVDFLVGTLREVAAWIYEQTGIELPPDKVHFEVFRNRRDEQSGALETFAIEDLEVIASDVIRAFETDGRERWSMAAGGLVVQLSGTPMGGVAASIDTTPPSAAERTGVIRVYGADGSPFDVAQSPEPFAIHPAGPLYTFGGAGLVGLDIGLGPGTTAALPTGTFTTCAVSADGSQSCQSEPRVFGTGAPTVLEDGRVALPVLTGWSTHYVAADSGNLPNFVPDDQCSGTVQVLLVAPNGSTTVQTAAQYPGVNCGLGSTTTVFLHKAIPNGHGGVLVQYELVHPQPIGWSAMVNGLDANGALTGDLAMGRTWGDLVVGDQDAILATTSVDNNRGGDSPGGMLAPLTPQGNAAGTATLYDPSRAVTSVVAVGGGFLISLADGTVSGPGDGFDQMHLTNVQPAGSGTYLGMGLTNTIVDMAGPTVAVSNSSWPFASAVQAAEAAVNQNLGIFVKSHLIPLSQIDFGGYDHTFLLIVPTHQDKWPHGPSDTFHLQDGKNWFATIGAASSIFIDPTCLSSYIPMLGRLVSAVDRGTDVTLKQVDRQKVFYPSALEDDLIATLIKLNSNYAGDLAYACIPPVDGPGWNSNSYTAGLLKAAPPLGLPTFPFLKPAWYPGWTKPVPRESFTATPAK